MSRFSRSQLSGTQQTVYAAISLLVAIAMVLTIRYATTNAESSRRAAKTPQVLIVPDAVGLSLDYARDLLTESGLETCFVQTRESDFIEEPNIVVEQTPSPLSRASSTACVELVISE